MNSHVISFLWFRAFTHHLGIVVVDFLITSLTIIVLSIILVYARYISQRACAMFVFIGDQHLEKSSIVLPEAS